MDQYEVRHDVDHIGGWRFKSAEDLKRNAAEGLTLLNIESATAGELLGGYRSILAELKSRGLIRTNNAPLGDMAEFCGRKVFGGELQVNSTAAYDLIDRKGRRIQIKARQLAETKAKARRFSGLKTLDFDLCLFLIVDNDRVVRASEWTPVDIAENLLWREKSQSWSVTVGHILRDPQIGTDRTEEFQTAWLNLLNSTTPPSEEDEITDIEGETGETGDDEDELSLVEQQLQWAGKYNAYDRLAKEPSDFDRLLRGPRSEYRESGRIPQWSGVDLLKGWAFYLYREDYFAGGGLLGREFQDVLEAVSRHPARDVEDMPPGF